MGKINSPHDDDQTWERIKSYFEAKDPLAKMGVKGEVNFDDSSKQINISGKGFDGKIQVASNSVNYDLKLGLIFKPLKGKVEEVIEKYINRALSDQA
jgi:hypothetical protein